MARRDGKPNPLSGMAMICGTPNILPEPPVSVPRGTFTMGYELADSGFRSGPKVPVRRVLGQARAERLGRWPGIQLGDILPNLQIVGTGEEGE